MEFIDFFFIGIYHETSQAVFVKISNVLVFVLKDNFVRICSYRSRHVFELPQTLGYLTLFGTSFDEIYALFYMYN